MDFDLKFYSDDVYAYHQFQSPLRQVPVLTIFVAIEFAPFLHFYGTPLLFSISLDPQVLTQLDLVEVEIELTQRALVAVRVWVFRYR